MQQTDHGHPSVSRTNECDLFSKRFDQDSESSQARAFSASGVDDIVEDRLKFRHGLLGGVETEGHAEVEGAPQLGFTAQRSPAA